MLNDFWYGFKVVIECCYDIFYKMVGEYNFVVDFLIEINDNYGKKGMNYCFFYGFFLI